MSTPDPLQNLLRQVERLWPDWTDQRAFHEGKSEVIGTIKSLIAAGGVPSPPSPAPPPHCRPTPTSAPTRARAQTPPRAPAPPRPRPNLLITLPADRHLLLLGMATEPSRSGFRPHRGSFQDRCRGWADAIDERTLTLVLSPSEGDWIVRQIKGRRRGGYQGRTAAIFMDVHPAFAHIPALPRRRA
jgi:hypothetical protein